MVTIGLGGRGGTGAAGFGDSAPCSSATGAPQPGQLLALSEISRRHSEHLTSAMRRFYVARIPDSIRKSNLTDESVVRRVKSGPIDHVHLVCAPVSSLQKAAAGRCPTFARLLPLAHEHGSDVTAEDVCRCGVRGDTSMEVSAPARARLRVFPE